METSIDPKPDAIDVHADYFGNQVVSFSIESLHQMLVVNVKSEVTVHQHGQLPSDDLMPWEQVAREIRSCDDPRWFEVQEYVQDSIDETPTVVFVFCRFQTHNYSIGIGQ